MNFTVFELVMAMLVFAAIAVSAIVLCRDGEN